MGYVKIIIVALLAIVGILVIIQNIENFNQAVSLQLNLYVWEGCSSPFPIYLMIMLAFLLGVFLTSLIGFSERIRMRRVIKDIERKCRDLEQEIYSVRKLSFNLQPAAGDKSGS